MAEVHELGAPAASLIRKSKGTGPHVLPSSIVAENALLAGRQALMECQNITSCFAGPPSLR